MCGFMYAGERRLVEKQKEKEIVRSIVSVTHADTLQTRITKNKRQITTYVATQETWKVQETDSATLTSCVTT
jgi:predicted membrane chloride channel (bestrophin family)